MNIEKMREEFLASFVKQFGFGRMAASSNADAAAMLTCAEWAWFASRESLVIDLPTEYDCCGGTTSYEIRDMAIEAVKDAGLKVKP